MCWLLALHPALIPAFLHLLLLRSMCWQYVRRRYIDNMQMASVVMMDGVVLESAMAEHASGATRPPPLGLLPRCVCTQLTILCASRRSVCAVYLWCQQTIQRNSLQTSVRGPVLQTWCVTHGPNRMLPLPLLLSLLLSCAGRACLTTTWCCD